ncbi:MAG TPA: hypothetical protein VMT82_09930 [candidate division Zixibacteria bacterium]|nr:hypothetical protein [Candidatus Binatia bacterium]HVP65206.1 hypothetical protein [candidate division Zixibacteria bacterium]
MNEQQANIRANFEIRYIYRPSSVEVRAGITRNVGVLLERYHPDADEYIGGVFRSISRSQES